MDQTNDALACTISASEGEDQLLGWQDLQRAALSVERLDNGVAMTFEPEIQQRVEEVSAAEAQCCSFLDLETRLVDGKLLLEITSAHEQAVGIIDMIAGAPER